jgi:hypothetical protein
VRVNERGRPVKIIKRVLLDHSNAFDLVNVGNTLKIKDANVGFFNGGFGLDTDVRVISLEYNDLSNKVPLNVEVI